MSKLIFLYFIFLFFAIGTNKVDAQNERLIRNLLKGKFAGLEEPTGAAVYKAKESLKWPESGHKWLVKSPFYYLDKIGMQIEKKDLIDYVSFFDSTGSLLKRYKLDTLGDESWAYKLEEVRLSNKTKLMLLYYYRGNHKYHDFSFYGDSIVYLITIDNEDLNTSSLTAGPIIWEEDKGFPRKYHHRYYNFKLQDLNQDGVQEVIFQHQKILKVYYYLGNGSWRN